MEKLEALRNMMNALTLKSRIEVLGVLYADLYAEAIKMKQEGEEMAGKADSLIEEMPFIPKITKVESAPSEKQAN